MKLNRFAGRRLAWVLVAGVSASALAWTVGSPTSDTPSPSASSTAPVSSAPTPIARSSAMTLGPGIVIDQFGYLPSHQKVAVIRDPQTGYDAGDSLTPGGTYQVVNAANNAVVFTGSPVAWNNGAEDSTSGDKVWHFDFSGLTAAGTYFVRDRDRGVVSPRFKIGTNLYTPVLKAAVRTFFYQRAGQVKTAANAGTGWADGASHVGPGQDRNARLYSAKTNAATERDVSGGWYDAGDMNKYTSWTAGYVVDLLHSYLGNKPVWTDDYNIPESGNGVPDIVDEAKWGLDWLGRMQQSNGSVLSIVGVSHASPPSSATGPSYYGPASTSATLNAAAAYAIGSKVLGGFPAHSNYAATMRTRAENAWNWAVANPNVTFRNNDPANGSEGLGAGQQETDDYGRFTAKLIAAIYLYDATGKTVYRDFVDANYNQANLIRWYNYVSPYDANMQLALLYYSSLSGATASTATAIRNAYNSGMESQYLWGKITGKADPYMAYIPDYIWGSNAIKGVEANLYLDLRRFGVGNRSEADVMAAAGGYAHYLHGVNPFGKVYLTNMYSLGATNSTNQIFHAWFTDGSAKWDDAKNSTYGPPPGILVGGPNYNQWDWDSRCPGISAACGTERPRPPYGQPPQKSYKDFNDGWPLQSWPISENSNGYQASYIRMLSRLK
ncbi:LacI family transcriptional regulator [Sphingomonas spermidinifaciens]|uniref:LacI family transcriptional regulator n=2 Tax=Sphingomonas spermidinifaciens TaxID=1141889 RepID=A0A2A4B2J9_9SPHN|nr:LacI family transcriptional regulator [Sphingomonas spermidinifaciens]